MTPGRFSLPLALLVLSFLMPANSAPAAAQTQCWTAAGTTLSFDPATQSNLSFALSQLSVNPAAALPVNAVGRININGIFDDLGVYPDILKVLGVRYIDNGPEAQVLVELRQVDVLTGALSNPWYTFDSDAYPQLSTPQTIQVAASACGLNQGFSSVNKLNFLRVVLRKTGPGGNPQLHMLQACQASCA
jgi:hypothetical protein